MENKLIFISVFVLLVTATAVHAAGMDNNAKNTVVKDGSVYRIVDDKFIIFIQEGGKTIEYRRIIFQNLTELDELNQLISKIEPEVEQLNKELVDANNKTAELEAQKNIWENALTVLKERRDALKDSLNALKEKESDFSNRITSNIVATPLSYQSAVALLIVMLAIVIIVKGRQFMKD